MQFPQRLALWGMIGTAGLALAGCPLTDQKPTSLQAFVVIGAGNGIALAGREVLFFDDKIEVALHQLKTSYDEDIKKISADGLTNDPEAAAQVADLTQQLHKAEAELAEVANKTSEPQADFSKDAARAVTAKKKEIENKVAELKASLSDLKQRQSSLKVITSEFDQKIDALQQKIRTSKKTREDLARTVTKQVNDVIINERLPERQINLTVDSFSGEFTDCKYAYRFCVPLPNPRDVYKSVVIREIPEKLGSKLRDVIREDAARILILRLEIDQYEEDSAKLTLSRRNAITPWTRQNGSPEALADSMAKAEAQIHNLETSSGDLSEQKVLASLVADETHRKESDLQDRKDRVEKLESEIAAIERSASQSAREVRTDILEPQIAKLFLENAISKAMTDLEGKVKIPSKARYAYLSASRMGAEHYQWFARIEGTQDPFILANHNVSDEGEKFGEWVFKTLPRASKK